MNRAPAEVGSAASNYEVLAKLAKGGMAELFLARGASAAGIERYVVLKRVLRDRASDVHFVQMFLDEARLAAQLQHPNIAQVYDIGQLGDSYFFTMEYVHGETVRDVLARSHGLRQPIPISAVLAIIAGAAAGLQHAHERRAFDGRHLGIVHRDVSPSNLMVSYEGTVKVVDFGVAKASHRRTETQSGKVKGKISYMSPEQCQRGDIDRRSDLFSLGIVMWELLTSEKLFRRGSDFETMQAIIADDVPPPSQLRAEIPPEIDHVVMRLLAKHPEQRYRTADELHEAIENVAVCTGSALSSASLARYMREVFGQRPEPWLDAVALPAKVLSATSIPQYPIATSSHSLAPVRSREHSGRHEAAPHRWRVPIMVIPALMVCVVMGIVLALGSGDDRAKPIAAAAAVPSNVTTMVAIPEPIPAPPPVPSVVHVESPPGSVVSETRIDEPPTIAMPDDQITPAPKPEVAILYKAGNYSEVVAVCSSSPRIVTLHATACTVAACKVKQSAKARRWFPFVGAARKQGVIEQCDGVLAAEKPALDEVCLRDPLACRQ